MAVATNKRRIAKNTLFLYGRMLFSLIVSFLTAGVLLSTLGVVDYGIYNVVGGLVIMFSLVSGSLSASTSRFLTFELGKEDGEPNKVFNASLQIHLLIIAVVVVLLETVGLWFLEHEMNIPQNRMLAAQYVFQFSVFAFALNLLSVTYNADIIANEHMDAFAYIGILDTVLRLIILYLLWIGNFDKLILYSFLQFAVSLIIQSVYMIYCRYNFEESKLHRTFHKDMFLKIAGFSGWNFIGSSAALLRDQGVNLCINIFCGPAINASRAIGVRVNSMVSVFGHNLLSAFNPQITKNYASGNLVDVTNLCILGSRYGFLLLFLISFPIMVRMEYLLELWLHNVPEHSVAFGILALLLSLVDILSIPLITLLLATGDIKWYQISVGGTLLLNVPISYVLLRLGYAPEWTVVVAIGLSLVCLFIRLKMAQMLAGFPINRFLKEVLVKVVTVTIIALLFYWTTTQYFNLASTGAILYVLTCGAFNMIILYFIGLNRNERVKINVLVIKHLHWNKLK